MRSTVLSEATYRHGVRTVRTLLLHNKVSQAACEAADLAEYIELETLLRDCTVNVLPQTLASEFVELVEALIKE